MSVEASTWAWGRIAELGLPHGEALVLLRIANHANAEGVSWPGNENMAPYCGMTERSVRANLKRLEGRDLLTRRSRQRKRGRGRAADLLILAMSDQPEAVAGESLDHDQPEADDRPTGRSRHDQPEDPGNLTTYREPSVEPSVEPSASSSPSDAEVERLCELMAELSNERSESRRFKVTAAWRREMERLVRLDGRTPEQIEYVIRWVHADAFWGPNVLAVPKLRERFDQLVAKIKVERQNGAGRKPAGRSASEYRAMAAELRRQGK